MTPAEQDELRQRLLSDPKLVEVFLADMLHRKKRAQTSLPDFFETVMLHETKRTPLKLAPHQRVFMDFMMAHDTSVNMLPIGHSKTFCTAAVSLFLLGQDPTSRGAIVSATQGQAAKPLSMVASYVQSSDQLHMVFPDLRPMAKMKGGKWTDTAITVERPSGIRDPSLVALGLDGAVAGARLNWIVVDDILNRQNTASKDQRNRVYEWFDSSVLSRLDPVGGRVVLTNTAWHPDDLLHRSRDAGWPTLRMDMLGDIEIENTEWDHPALRPKTHGDFLCRLVAHDPDPNNEALLWPEVRGYDYLADVRKRHLPKQFNQLFRNITRDDGTAMCQISWIDKCKALAREAKCHTMVSEYPGPNPVFIGVDLAMREGKDRDETVFFVFEVLPSRHRRILEIDAGQWNGTTIVDKIMDKRRRYPTATFIVEDNVAQKYILDFTLSRDPTLPLKSHTTTSKNKSDPQYGVVSVFMEIQNGAWLIPNDSRGICHPQVQKFIDACLYYTPTKHTDDVLMAAWFGIFLARKWGLGHEPPPAGGPQAKSIAATIMSR